MNWNVPAGALITSHPAGTGTDDTVIVVTYSGSFTGGVITVSGNSNCGTGGIRSLVISANLKPGTASAIAAVETQLCPDRQVTYSLAALPVSANWVQWTIPANGTILSGQGTSSITVAYSSLAITGSVTATPSNGCGSSKTRVLPVNLSPCLPPGPFVKGMNTIHAPQEGTYEVSIFPNPVLVEFEVRVKGSSKQQVQIRLYDVTGKRYIHMITNPGQPARMGKELKAGIYFVEVVQGNRKNTYRIVKL